MLSLEQMTAVKGCFGACRYVLLRGGRKRPPRGAGDGPFLLRVHLLVSSSAPRSPFFRFVAMPHSVPSSAVPPPPRCPPPRGLD